LNIAFLTAGGIAPCLSSSISSLIKYYNKSNHGNNNFFGYLHGYKGLLTGNIIKIPNVDCINELNNFGGSILGNSRVKLSNIDDCEKNGYIKKGQNPLELAANQLKKDKIDVLHTIGGDDTNTTAGDLVDYLSNINYNLVVVGLPKTIDNDVIPIKQTMGAFTAADQASNFFENIVNENTTSSRQLIIHEVMGRNCGWLTAYSAYLYREKIDNKNFFPEILLNKEKWDIHAVYIPELDFKLSDEVKRLNKIMDKYDCVNIFLSEGAGINNILNEMKANNKEIKYDAFGHVRLDEINPGKWFANYFKTKLNCDKILVQKSGYFSRSSSPNNEDLKLIDSYSKKAVESSLSKISGVVGLSDDSNLIECINFKRIKGGKSFDITSDWFDQLLREIGQKN